MKSLRAEEPGGFVEELRQTVVCAGGALRAGHREWRT